MQEGAGDQGEGRSKVIAAAGSTQHDTAQRPLWRLRT